MRSATTVDQELINHCPALKYVIRAGEGDVTDNIDKKYCQDRGSKVSNTPEQIATPAAEHAVALMFTDFTKNVTHTKVCKEGRWDKNLL